uniref:Endonuclease/exonuclease/phosphatase domain-containing protein n=1 Tax=Chromera velia CCMP2878 TaxID=1169474 RepID=A0A0G4HHH4_9ALVE|eukprot:Cvel_6876.t1-p1 / transcript=Cvel_6876.t1 / gene=Cvel_6876 / organism=Chromera_velia_CCMP2878 / gene_product=hypothetical protein / transcript_product=hypothetical protein / location=Cvel_scaffold347:89461-90468(+) / protein_length=336 / sequence_SO=supercontig / SO=protein_coding / is_pseudo=false
MPTTRVKVGGFEGENFSYREWFRRKMNVHAAARDKNVSIEGVAILVRSSLIGQYRPTWELVAPSVAKVVLRGVHLPFYLEPDVPVSSSPSVLHVFGYYWVGVNSCQRGEIEQRARERELFLDALCSVPLEHGRVVIGDANVHVRTELPKGVTWVRDPEAEELEGREDFLVKRWERRSQCRKRVVTEQGKAVLQMCEQSNMLIYYGLSRISQGGDRRSGWSSFSDQCTFIDVTEEDIQNEGKGEGTVIDLTLADPSPLLTQPSLHTIPIPEGASHHRAVILAFRRQQDGRTDHSSEGDLNHRSARQGKAPQPMRSTPVTDTDLFWLASRVKAFSDQL